VNDGTELRIDSASAPSLVEAIEAARHYGFDVTIEPHLDWVATLTGGPYEWRRRMHLDPSAQYFDDVLGPLSLLRPDSLTLGSELDVSLVEFPEQWAEVGAAFPDISVGHKINHDFFDAGRAPLNEERTRRGLKKTGWLDFRDRIASVKEYLKQLEYVSFSFYPGAPSEADYEISFERLARRLARRVGPGFAIGEFGLGSTDFERPWHFDSSTFQTPAQRALRVRFYVAFLGWLKQQENVQAATFWTAGHFDILGVMDPQWGEATIRDLVESYNYASPYVR
jgi:hypothetical protein